jgi:hypothetical protein
MPRPAHRRCKEQGPTCNGVSHPGFDICSRCLNDVIRPRQREEREAVRQRKIARLSRENRILINETSLKEPQMATQETPATWWTTSDPPSPPPSIESIITDLDIERRVADVPNGLPQLQAKLEVLAKDNLKEDLKKDPGIISVPPPPPAEEPARPPGRRRLRTPETEAEIIEMFKSGISTTEIQEAYGIGPQTLYTLVKRAGVPLRGTHGPRPKYPKEPAVPEPVKTSPPVSDAPSVPTSPNGTVTDLAEWVVTYEVVRTETVTVAARSFNDAAASVTDGNVVSVARKR